MPDGLIINKIKKSKKDQRDTKIEYLNSTFAEMLLLNKKDAESQSLINSASNNDFTDNGS